MEIDELKALWVQSNRQLESSMRLNTLLFAQGNLDRAARKLGGLARTIGFEVALNAIAPLLLGAFAADHWTEPAFLVPAILLEIYAIAIFAAGVRQLIEVGSIDYDEPVVAIQLRLERLRILRIRTTLATLLFAPLMWVPLLLVCARAFFGVNLYAAGPAWLAANALFGVAFIVVAVTVARMAGPRLLRSRTVRRIADEIAGRGLAAALDDLTAIRRFAEEA